MSDYVIVSDATLDLPMTIINRYGIKIIPMGVEIDNVQYNHYPDEKEITIEKFYSMLKDGSVCHTTQIPPIIFMDYFSKLLEQGLDILYIAFSSGLSGTYNTVQLVIPELLEKYPKQKIYAVDSLCASIGEGLLVMHAAMQKEKGLDIEALWTWIENNKRAPRHWFTVKDLLFLKRGGRVSAIEAMVATALKIRPVLSTNNMGKLEVVTKVRGSRAELDFMISKMEDEGSHISDQTIIIGHGDDLEQAKELEALVRRRKLVKDIVVSKIGPVIGSHTGPGMLALTYMGKM
jgi:DegV family protein with EDD domain